MDAAGLIALLELFEAERSVQRKQRTMRISASAICLVLGILTMSLGLGMPKQSTYYAVLILIGGALQMVGSILLINYIGRTSIPTGLQVRIIFALTYSGLSSTTPGVFSPLLEAFYYWLPYWRLKGSFYQNSIAILTSLLLHENVCNNLSTGNASILRKFIQRVLEQRNIRWWHLAGEKYASFIIAVLECLIKTNDPWTTSKLKSLTKIRDDSVAQKMIKDQAIYYMDLLSR